eukprot:TRINITY_DN628_c0_g3_i1.p2 TRINITY_DN628_c0_g3~~TRINITY_DN628_c0_g3_i1.p2  ORF type:complete len:181 (-),score=34.24 TRINITY_DN628_c0_g3_i1:900-1442(-)
MNVHKVEMIHVRQCETSRVPTPNLPFGACTHVDAKNERPIMLLYQDESTFYSGDGQRGCWVDDLYGNMQPKGLGSSIMLSGFLCFFGWLVLNPNKFKMSMPRAAKGKKPLTHRCSIEMFEAGKNRSGWWDNNDLCRQTDEVLDMFEELYPDFDAYVVVDWSSNHAKRSEDSLTATQSECS